LYRGGFPRHNDRDSLRLHRGSAAPDEEASTE
jgi:hypothetical protein